MKNSEEKRSENIKLLGKNRKMCFVSELLKLLGFWKLTTVY